MQDHFGEYFARKIHSFPASILGYDKVCAGKEKSDFTRSLHKIVWLQYVEPNVKM